LPKAIHPFWGKHKLDHKTPDVKLSNFYKYGYAETCITKAVPNFDMFMLIISKAA